MTLPKPKSLGRIEVWRQEVASCTPAETELLQPPLRQPSFWKKILRRDSRSSGSANSKLKSQGDGKESVTEMYDDGLGVPDQGREPGRDSSMEIGSGESHLGGFSERRERLEKAAKLLDRSRKAKEEQGRKKAVT
ncbi:hypothetical protein V8E51_000788 [Hyaloscypha variabilis]